MRLKSLADLKSGLENAHKATSTTPIASEFRSPGAPEVSAKGREVSRPTPSDTISEMRAMRLALMAGWYETTVQEKPKREPDPNREYLGPRFLPPKARLPARKGLGNLG